MKKSFYVVISGVHASGKTSIIDSLNRKGGYSVLEETTDVSEINPLILSPFEREHWMFDNLERRELDIPSKTGVFITDRWVGDLLRYTDVFFELGLMNQSQRDSIMRRYWHKKWTMPDLEIVLTTDLNILKERIANRGRANTQKKQEIELAKRVKEKFEIYANAHSFNRKVHLFDTTGKSVEQCHYEIHDLIINHSKGLIV